MIRLLKEKETDKILEFINDKTREADCIRTIDSVYLSNEQLIRSWIFSTDIMCVGDMDSKDEIQKLLIVYVPQQFIKRQSITVSYSTCDLAFMKEAMNMISEMLDSENFTKFTISLRKSSKYLESIPEVENELEIDEKYYKQFIYSMFIDKEVC